MSTHSMIGQVQPEGDILAAYCHFDAEEAAQTIVDLIAGKPAEERQAILDTILKAPHGWCAIAGRDLTMPAVVAKPRIEKYPRAAEMLMPGDGLSPRLYENADKLCDAMGCFRVYVFSADLTTVTVYNGWTTTCLGTVNLDAPIVLLDHLKQG